MCGLCAARLEVEHMRTKNTCKRMWFRMKASRRGYMQLRRETACKRRAYMHGVIHNPQSVFLMGMSTIRVSCSHCV